VNDQGSVSTEPPDDVLAQASISHPPHPPTAGRNLALTIGALGVVFGDIGTSPLYAMRETLLSIGGHHPNPVAIFGSLSLIIWALFIVVTLKYVMLIMRADNDGEGGTLALASLAHRSGGVGRRVKQTIGVAALIGLALFFGDGMLTPAISVLSAVEGLGIGSRDFEPLIMPLTIVILLGLFAMQSRGTAKIGRMFGPFMIVWFAVLAVLGALSLAQSPGVLAAINPWYAIALFIHAPWHAFVSIGAVVLAVTGCEALYADMGHFGKGPIRRAWFVVVLPALLLEYLGQAAAILRDPSQASIAFYSVVPHWAHYPMVAMAAVASVIASQAVISGVFSITQQAVQLGQLPRMEVRHTSATDYGQIFVPRMNAYLCVGVVLIVLIFKSSSALAAAYGIAVTGVMVIDTMNVSLVAARQWKWNIQLVVLLFGLLAIIDLLFLSANLLKIPEGGWLPLAIAAAVFLMMEVWRSGRRAHLEKIRSESMPISLFLERADKTPMRVAGTAIFLSPRGDAVPGALLHNLKHNKVLHERIILAHVVVDDVPVVAAEKRIKVQKLGKGFYNVNIHHGFFETPDVPRALEDARPFGLAIDVETATFFIGHETLLPAEQSKLGWWRLWLYMRLVASAISPARFYHLPPNRVVELGTQTTI
jgi:KUP system potassium uptake protein